MHGEEAHDTVRHMTQCVINLSLEQAIFLRDCLIKEHQKDLAPPGAYQLFLKLEELIGPQTRVPQEGDTWVEKENPLKRWTVESVVLGVVYLRKGREIRDVEYGLLNRDYYFLKYKPRRKWKKL